MRTKKLFVFLLLLLSVLNISAQNTDLDILKGINPGNPNSGYWKAVSGSAYFVSAAVPTFLLTEGIVKNNPLLRRKARNVLGGILIELVISESMKNAFKRERPAETYPGIIFPYRDARGRSFPSGHTSLAFAAASGLSIQCKKWYVTVPAYLWAANVGYSRMYLGVHYPSDVIAGAAVGIGSAYLSQWLNKKLFPPKKTAADKVGF
jgi:membrane-associated phospholipid phosphatase